jgi:hypothetical protein
MLMSVQETLRVIEDLRDKRTNSENRLRILEEDEAMRKQLTVYNWLDEADSFQDQEKSCEDRARFPHSGLWLLQHSNVVRWLGLSVPELFLWINGKPGAGI